MTGMLYIYILFTLATEPVNQLRVYWRPCCGWLQDALQPSAQVTWPVLCRCEWRVKWTPSFQTLTSLAWSPLTAEMLEKLQNVGCVEKSVCISYIRWQLFLKEVGTCGLELCIPALEQQQSEVTEYNSSQLSPERGLSAWARVDELSSWQSAPSIHQVKGGDPCSSVSEASIARTDYSQNLFLMSVECWVWPFTWHPVYVLTVIKQQGNVFTVARQPGYAVTFTGQYIPRQWGLTVTRQQGISWVYSCGTGQSCPQLTRQWQQWCQTIISVSSNSLHRVEWTVMVAHPHKHTRLKVCFQLK